MATSNFKLFDENKSNMMSDEEYSANTQRVNGVQTGIASSTLENKAQYQTSLVAYAIAQLMLANGKNAMDSDAVSTFVANLSGSLLQKVVDIATVTDVIAGTINNKFVSPKTLKEYSLSDTTAAKYPNALTPNDVFALIPGLINNAWKLFQEYTAAGSYTWTAPDLFNGASYKVGVAIIGGGGSGAAKVLINPLDGSQYVGATGGNSGECICKEFTVVPGTSYAVVVGAGGGVASVSGTAQYISVTDLGKSGGTSSFSGITALGGNGTAVLSASGASSKWRNGSVTGGQMAHDIEVSTNTSDSYLSAQYSIKKASNCNPTIYFTSGSYFVPFVSSKNVNIFDGTTMSAGGGVSFCKQSSTVSNTASFLAGEGGGAASGGGTNQTATAGTDIGAGGGGACVYSASYPLTATSGAGHDGGVKIYVKGGTT